MEAAEAECLRLKKELDGIKIQYDEKAARNKEVNFYKGFVELFLTLFYFAAFKGIRNGHTRLQSKSRKENSQD
ncbi:hypothetical protein TELCIR_08892 [Teladorsagia circumcincta]|uniref:Uncharacterized protein n=1 Tax=Teladorsagia circumcincta TaxID=45464 RepID=A0A2G9UGB3_TELCI|nr:hypothetical protein TELCIR_08892 [Teladorsagia circumcincta]